LTSIARRKIIAYPEKAIALAEALQLAFSIPIRWNEVDHIDVLRIAVGTNLTTYDACYLYLAKKLGIPLTTFDRQLARVSQTK
jgi:predicted nucleic acid-binding protein